MASPKSTPIKMIGRKLTSGPTSVMSSGPAPQPQMKAAVTAPRAAAMESR